MSIHFLPVHTLVLPRALPPGAASGDGPGEVPPAAAGASDE
jgi:hypothetical protein